jgi:hypothetical protein
VRLLEFLGYRQEEQSRAAVNILYRKRCGYSGETTPLEEQRYAFAFGEILSLR